MSIAKAAIDMTRGEFEGGLRKVLLDRLGNFPRVRPVPQAQGRKTKEGGKNIRKLAIQKRHSFGRIDYDKAGKSGGGKHLGEGRPAIGAGPGWSPFGQ